MPSAFGASHPGSAGGVVLAQLVGEAAAPLGKFLRKSKSRARPTPGPSSVEQPVFETSLSEAVGRTAGIMVQWMGASPAPEVVMPESDAADTAFRAPAVVQVVVSPEPGGEPIASAGPLPGPEAGAPALPAASAHESARPWEPMQLRVEIKSDGITFLPDRLVVSRAGETVAVKVVNEQEGGASLFVRDPAVARLTTAADRLETVRKGYTELYVVEGGRMAILPIAVESSSGGPWDVQVPQELTTLAGVVPDHLGSAVFNAASPRPEPGKGGLSRQESVAQTRRSLATEARARGHFGLQPVAPAYLDVVVQVIDDRSVPEAGRIYPVAGAQVRFLGTAYTGVTDATGHLSIPEIPAQSRFMVAIDHPQGVIRPALVELKTGLSGDGVERLRVMRSFTFDAVTEIVGAAQDMGYGSMCVGVVDESEGNVPVAGLVATLDADADGPAYFNRYGYLDRSLRATGPDGRLCFFNIAPGPIALSLFDGETFVATLPLASYAGRHTEEVIDISTRKTLQTRLASAAAAQAQLSSDDQEANAFVSVDTLDLVPLGTGESMAQEDSGVLATANPVLPLRGRVWALAQDSDFESVLYGYDVSRRNHVTPLIPRGFVEDMSVYAQVAYDPALGVVIVAYPRTDGVPGGEALNVRLLNSDGRDAGEGWYYGDQPVTKAIFFNVPAGQYQVLVESHDHYWLSGETVPVYNETVTYAQPGGQLRFQN